MSLVPKYQTELPSRVDGPLGSQAHILAVSSSAAATIKTNRATYGQTHFSLPPLSVWQTGAPPQQLLQEMPGPLPA